MNKIKILFLLLVITILGVGCSTETASTKLDGGVWRSLNKGEEWQQRSVVYEDRTNKITILEFDVHKLVFSPNDTRKIFALTLRNGLWASWNAGKNWNIILRTTSVSDIAIDPENHRTIYVANANVIIKSEDEGETWHSIYTSDNVTNTVNTLEISRTNSNIIYAGTNKGEILISENEGRSWRVLSDLSSPVLKLSFHPSNPSIGYAGVSKKGLFQSTDSGETWTSFEPDLKEYRGTNEFRSFVFIPSGIIYASRYGLLRSLNQGRDWTPLPLLAVDRDSNIQTLAVNPENPMEIYYGTRATFYKSSDGGFNWIPRSLPSSRSASSLIINPENTNEIFLGAVREK